MRGLSYQQDIFGLGRYLFEKQFKSPAITSQIFQIVITRNVVFLKKAVGFVDTHIEQLSELPETYRSLTIIFDGICLKLLTREISINRRLLQ